MIMNWDINEDVEYGRVLQKVLCVQNMFCHIVYHCNDLISNPLCTEGF